MREKQLTNMDNIIDKIARQLLSNISDKYACDVNIARIKYKSVPSNHILSVVKLSVQCSHSELSNDLTLLSNNLCKWGFNGTLSVSCDGDNGTYKTDNLVFSANSVNLFNEFSEYFSTRAENKRMGLYDCNDDLADTFDDKYFDNMTNITIHIINKNTHKIDTYMNYLIHTKDDTLEQLIDKFNRLLTCQELIYHQQVECINKLKQCYHELELCIELKRNKDNEPYYMVLDTETTISKPQRVIQLCWALYDKNHQIICVKNHLIYPENFKVNGTRIHGITQTIARNKGKKYNDVIGQFARDIDCVQHVIGHNIAFDIRVIKMEDTLRGLDVYDEIKKKNIICTMKKLKEFCNTLGKNGQIKYPRLDEAYTIVCNKDIAKHHDAKWDVINLGEIVTKLSAEMKTQLFQCTNKT